MNIIARTESLSKLMTNESTRKNLNLMLGHLKLLYKYKNDERMPFSGNTFKRTDFYLGTRNTHKNERALSQLSVVFSIAKKLLEPYLVILELEYSSLLSRSDINGSNIENFLEHVLDLIEISLVGEEQIEEGNVFLGIDEKLQRAHKSIREGNPEGLFSNLHTVFELLLKDKLGIALDMDGARLGKVLRICIDDNIFPGKNSILNQVNNDVCEVDNKIKHTGYNPTPKQINDALLITTQAVRVLKKEIPKPKEGTLDKISAILVKNN